MTITIMEYILQNANYLISLAALAVLFRGLALVSLLTLNKQSHSLLLFCSETDCPNQLEIVVGVALSAN